MWLFGQFAATGSSAASYQQAEEPVSQLINDYGPPVASPAAARQRAAMPFVHLERDLWDLRRDDRQVLGLLETIDRALPVTSAFVGEHLGGDEPGTAAVAPLLEQLLGSIR